MNPKKDTSHHPAFAAPREYFSDDYGAPACMNKRMYAAIKLRVPDSGEEWLDDMIRQSLRDEFAGKAMQSWVQGILEMNDAGKRSQYKLWIKLFGENVNINDAIAKEAYLTADAMLKARTDAQDAQ